MNYFHYSRTKVIQCHQSFACNKLNALNTNYAWYANCFLLLRFRCTVLLNFLAETQFLHTLTPNFCHPEYLDDPLQQTSACMSPGSPWATVSTFIKKFKTTWSGLDGLSSVLRPRQHSIGYMGDGFYRSKDPTNNIKVLKEHIDNAKIQ